MVKEGAVLLSGGIGRARGRILSFRQGRCWSALRALPSDRRPALNVRGWILREIESRRHLRRQAYPALPVRQLEQLRHRARWTAP